MLHHWQPRLRCRPDPLRNCSALRPTPTAGKRQISIRDGIIAGDKTLQSLLPGLLPGTLLGLLPGCYLPPAPPSEAGAASTLDTPCTLAGRILDRTTMRDRQV